MTLLKLFIILSLVTGAALVAMVINKPWAWKMPVPVGLISGWFASDLAQFLLQGA